MYWQLTSNVNNFNHFTDCSFFFPPITLRSVAVSDVLHRRHAGSRDHLAQERRGDFRARPVCHLQGTQGQHHHHQQGHGGQFGKVQRLCAQPVRLRKGGRDRERLQVRREAAGKCCGDGLKDGVTCVCVQVSQSRDASGLVVYRA